MKFFILITILVYSVFSRGQNNINGLWLPVDRVKRVYEFKRDSCDSPGQFPFKKIEFITKDKVSILTAGAGDPFYYRIKPVNNLSWKISDKIVSTKNFPFSSSNVVMKILKDTLYTSVITNKDTLSQKFVRKHKDVVLNDYNESEVGNLFISGKYKTSNGNNLVEFSGNGRIINLTGAGKNERGHWHYTSYKFRVYAQECGNNSGLNKIIELRDNKNKSELFVLKRENNLLNFYAVRKMKNRWEPEAYSFSFSIIN